MTEGRKSITVNVVTLGLVEFSGVDPNVIGLLQKLLADAKRGEVIAIAVAVELREREIAHAYTGKDIDVHRMVGAIEQLKLRMLRGDEET